MKRVFCLIGGPGSGKTTVANHLIAAHGCSYISISETLRIVALGHGIDVSNFDALHEFADEFRRLHGRGIFARFTISILAGREWEGAIVDGARSVETLKIVEQFCTNKNWDLVSIGLDVHPQVALDRIVHRNRERDLKSADKLSNYIEENFDRVAKALPECRYSIVNTGSRETLLSKVDEIVN